MLLLNMKYFIFVAKISSAYILDRLEAAPIFIRHNVFSNREKCHGRGLINYSDAVLHSVRDVIDRFDAGSKQKQVAFNNQLLRKRCEL